MKRYPANSITDAMNQLARDRVLYTNTKLSIGVLSFYDSTGEELARYIPCVEELTILNQESM